jgi:hypothetical protein
LSGRKTVISKKRSKKDQTGREMGRFPNTHKEAPSIRNNAVRSHAAWIIAEELAQLLSLWSEAKRTTTTASKRSREAE